MYMPPRSNLEETNARDQWQGGNQLNYIGGCLQMATRFPSSIGRRRVLLPSYLAGSHTQQSSAASFCATEIMVVPVESLFLNLGTVTDENYASQSCPLHHIRGADSDSDAMAATMHTGSIQLRGHMLGSLHGRCSSCAARQTYLIANSRYPRRAPATSHGFSTSSGKRPRFSQRLGEALRKTKVQWYRIPVGLGIGFLGLVQFYKVSSREKDKEKRKELQDVQEEGKKPRRRARVRPEGPWYVNASTCGGDVC